MTGEPRVEERRYIYTELFYLDGEGEIVTTDRLPDDTWYDTVSIRPWTEDEKADYGLEDGS